MFLSPTAYQQKNKELMTHSCQNKKISSLKAKTSKIGVFELAYKLMIQTLGGH